MQGLPWRLIGMAALANHMGMLLTSVLQCLRLIGNANVMTGRNVADVGNLNGPTTTAVLANFMRLPLTHVLKSLLLIDNAHVLRLEGFWLMPGP